MTVLFFGLWHLFVFYQILFPTPLGNIGRLTVLDRFETVIADLPRPDGFFIPLGDNEPIPETLKKAFLTIEDDRFDSHLGVDLPAKLRSLRDNISQGKIVSGGSTITEQMLKNRYFWYAPRSVLEKLREATAAFEISLVQSKDQIFKNYLDSIYFGNRNYGIKAAMKAYFDKSHLETLTHDEIVFLLTLLRAPGTSSLKEISFVNRFEQVKTRLGFPDAKIPQIRFKPFKGFDRFPHVTGGVRQTSPQPPPWQEGEKELRQRRKKILSCPEKTP